MHPLLRQPPDPLHGPALPLKAIESGLSDPQEFDSGCYGFRGYETLSQRELTLELQRIRASANAARLEAQAAEIELLLSRLRANNHTEEISNLLATHLPAATSPASPVRNVVPNPHLIDSWQSLLAVARRRPVTSPAVDSYASIHSDNLETPETNETSLETKEDKPQGVESTDQPLKTLLPVVARNEVIQTVGAQAVQARTIEAPQVSVPSAQKPSAQKPSAKQLTANARPARGVNAIQHASPTSSPKGAPPATKLVIAANEAAEPNRRVRPAAWLVSLAGHTGALLILAFLTVASRVPQDHLALSAAIAAPETSIETVTLEQIEQPQESTIEEQPQANVSTNDVLQDVAEMNLDVASLTSTLAQTSVASDALSELLSTSMSGGGSLADSVGGPSAGELSSQFFGAGGEGKHFVYLVDNSGSMNQVSRDGFDVARNELLRAVETLRPDQRFYVVFFGETTLRMQFGDAEPELQSVYATEDNKAALRRWAHSLSTQPGKWPKEALEIAFELRPDCIFLLTDGAMPDYVGKFIAEHNVVESIISDPRPRSIIHTLGFHNREGETQLSAIAASNGGTYHFVPPPTTANPNRGAKFGPR